MTWNQPEGVPSRKDNGAGPWRAMEVGEMESWGLLRTLSTNETIKQDCLSQRQYDLGRNTRVGPLEVTER